MVLFFFQKKEISSALSQLLCRTTLSLSLPLLEYCFSFMFHCFSSLFVLVLFDLFIFFVFSPLFQSCLFISGVMEGEAWQLISLLSPFSFHNFLLFFFLSPLSVSQKSVAKTIMSSMRTIFFLEKREGARNFND